MREYLIYIMEIFIDITGYEIKNYSKIDNYKKIQIRIFNYSIIIINYMY